MDFLQTMKDKAKSSIKTIVLPESTEIRNLKAAAAAMEEGIAKIVLLGKEEEIKKAAEGYGVNVDGAIIIDPATYEKRGEMIDLFCELRKKKGVTPEQAEKQLADPLYFACMLVKMDLADGMVSGATCPTGDVLRPALQILKTAPGTKIVSSFFVMVTKDAEFGEDGILMFADCVVNQNPNPEELASIAVDTGKSFKTFIGAEPRVAMLSHSTMGSASHPDVDKVVEATKLAKEKAPDMMLDGEMQLDAAIIPAIGNQKAPNSPVAGKANCLVFPDIDAGNIGYKLVQRFGHAEALGPVLQGISKPVNDLSRGCSAEDIVAVIAMTAVQCQMND